MNKNKGFTLIETIIGLFLISLIAIFLLPSLFSIYKNSVKIKKNSKILFTMQEVLEKSKKREIGEYEDIEGGVEVHTKVEPYNKNLKYIEVKSSNYVLDVVVKKWKKEDSL